MTKLLMPAVLVLLSSFILSATLFADAPEPKAYLFFALGLLVLLVLLGLGAYVFRQIQKSIRYHMNKPAD
ncbi:hypothetical protein [Acinetobacter sp. YH12120]|uniref:hypothetical protein n=1 Tax=Acinetobacter sp. YH12120 TaxID=2601107 RepID=UPI0015D34E81|nr:hypothetical protein [Acinetobacter sp. YH12120]